MKKLLVILPALALFAQSCEHKDYQEPQFGEPSFSISGQRNDEAFSLAAGVDGLIQTASIERNKYGVMEWRSNFVDASCPTCDPVFSLIFHDREGSTLSDCANLDLFNLQQLEFATVPTTSAFTQCQLSLSEENSSVNFEAEDAQALGDGSFFFENNGVQEISASYQIENDLGQSINAVTIRQTIFAGAHHHMSHPFLYEVLENEDGENQSIRVHFPDNNPQLRATHWEINGIYFDDDSRTLTIPNNQTYEIRIHFINDAVALDGYYSISFDQGFPIHQEQLEQNHLTWAPRIFADWETATPNYEKAIIEYRWNGKLYSSTTALNSLPGGFIELLGYDTFAAGLQGKNAISSDVRFNVQMTEVGNESNVLLLENCAGTFGFTLPE